MVDDEDSGSILEGLRRLDDGDLASNATERHKQMKFNREIIRAVIPFSDFYDFSIWTEVKLVLESHAGYGDEDDMLMDKLREIMRNPPRIVDKTKLVLRNTRVTSQGVHETTYGYTELPCSREEWESPAFKQSIQQIEKRSAYKEQQTFPTYNNKFGLDRHETSKCIDFKGCEGISDLETVWNAMQNSTLIECFYFDDTSPSLSQNGIPWNAGAGREIEGRMQPSKTEKSVADRHPLKVMISRCASQYDGLRLAKIISVASEKKLSVQQFYALRYYLFRLWTLNWHNFHFSNIFERLIPAAKDGFYDLIYSTVQRLEDQFEREIRITEMDRPETPIFQILHPLPHIMTSPKDGQLRRLWTATTAIKDISSQMMPKCARDLTELYMTDFTQYFLGNVTKNKISDEFSTKSRWRFSTKACFARWFSIPLDIGWGVKTTLENGSSLFLARIWDDTDETTLERYLEELDEMLIHDDSEELYTRDCEKHFDIDELDERNYEGLPTLLEIQKEKELEVTSQGEQLIGLDDSGDDVSDEDDESDENENSEDDEYDCEDSEDDEKDESDNQDEEYERD